MPKFMVATVQVIVPIEEGEDEASCCDGMSGLLSNNTWIHDWRYILPAKPDIDVLGMKSAWKEVRISPLDYEEGEAFIPGGVVDKATK